MEWSLGRVRELVADGIQSVRDCESSAVGTAACLLLLFLWYCYRVGREHGSSPLRGRYGGEPGHLRAGVLGGGGETAGAAKGSPPDEQNGLA